MKLRNNILKIFTNFYEKFFCKKDNYLQLGRWKIDYCPNILEKKIFLTNEDHCGPCGQYRLHKIDTNNIYNKKPEK